MNTHLVLGRHRVDIVAPAEAAVLVDQELGHDEQRYPLAAPGCTGNFRQYQVHDIVGRVVVAPGDEYLLPVQAIVVALGDGPGFHDPEVGTGTGLGEVHRRGPLTGVYLLEVGLLLCLGTVGIDCQRRAQ